MGPFEIRFRVEVKRPMLVRDAAAGSGRCDSVALLRGLEPPVPASSVTGRVKDALRSFLRDAAATWPELRACQGQDSGDAEQPHCTGSIGACPMCRLFGRPGGRHPRGVECSGTHYAPSDLAKLNLLYGATSSKARGDLVIAPRGRHMRDERRRRARDTHLWSEGPAIVVFHQHGVVLETFAHARLEEKVRKLDRCLVTAALSLVDSFGSHRTKDFGHCVLHPADGDEEQWRQDLRVVRDSWVSSREAGRS